MKNEMYKEKQQDRCKLLAYKNVTFNPHIDFGVLIQWLGH